MLLKYIQYGAGREVGRSCIGLIFPDKTRLLLDAGSKFIKEGVLYAEIASKSLKKVQAVFVSHSHDDHVGGLPYLNSLGLECPIITNHLTKDISEVLLYDSYEIEKKNKRAKYGLGRVVRVVDHLMVTSFGGTIGKVHYDLIPSGHIPGSSSVLLEYEGKRILYTSDINYYDTKLLKGSGRLPRADVLIIDSTYGLSEHGSRENTLANFKKKILQVIARGGSVLIGVFGVARAQEVMIFINELKLDIPIYLDGMARSVTDIYLRYDEHVNVEKLRQANQNIIRIDSKSDRSLAIDKKQAIYIATSGMFGGGPVLEFLQSMAHDPKSAVIITGYQPSGTGGRQLLETKSIRIRQSDDTIKKVEIRGDVEKYGLSAHAGRKDLAKIMGDVDPKVVIAQHGSPEAVDAVVAFARQQGRIAYGPANRKIIALNL